MGTETSRTEMSCYDMSCYEFCDCFGSERLSEKVREIIIEIRNEDLYSRHRRIQSMNDVEFKK
jgi:hypothetical protein